MDKRQEAALRQMREARQVIVDVGELFGHAPEARRVRLLRPPEGHFGQLRREGLSVDKLVEYTAGWDGFTEADLLPPGVGASSPIEFAHELWAELLNDRADLIKRTAQALMDAVAAHLERKAATAGN